MKFIYKIPGPILILMGSFFLSYGGIVVKSFEGADLWQIVFWRSIFCAMTIGIFLLITYKKKAIEKFKIAGFPGFVAGFFMSLSFSSYVFAMYHTTVANVNFIIPSQIIFLAMVGYFFLKEKISVYTLISIVLALSGILLMVGFSVSSEGFLGNIVALLIPISFTALVTVVRKNPNVDMVPAMFIAGLLAALYASLIVKSFYISPKDSFFSFFSWNLSNWLRLHLPHNWFEEHTGRHCGNIFTNRSYSWTNMGLDIYK